jgi:hypothetical protein
MVIASREGAKVTSVTRERNDVASALSLSLYVEVSPSPAGVLSLPPL